MPGNEKEIAKYLVAHKRAISLPHLGEIKSIGAPNPSKQGYIEIDKASEVDSRVSEDESRKKADIYLNDHGVSLKQAGPCNLFNRLQRANILSVFTHLGFKNQEHILQLLDREVASFHNGNLETRNRPWEDFFNEEEFKSLLRFLMTEGSPNVGFSLHPAEFILEAPSRNIAEDNIAVFTFEEYFEEYKSNLKIAIRRVWYGQASNSEHKRASGLIKKSGNAPWIFNNVSGLPKKRVSGKIWRQDIPASERKTVYFLMIEKERYNFL